MVLISKNNLNPILEISYSLMLKLEIMDSEIRFCNTDYNKIVFKARIDRDKIDIFMSKLLEELI